MLKLLCRAGDPKTLDQVRKWAFDLDGTDELRLQSLNILAEVQDGESRENFLSLLGDSSQSEMVATLIEGVRRTAKDEDAQEIIDIFLSYVSRYDW